ncbi:hypothetical protein QE152_g40334, partial [Popillia japonica]
NLPTSKRDWKFWENKY